MTLKRGDVGLVRFPHTAGARGKKRPVVIVQANVYNSRLNHVVVAEVMSNLGERGDPGFLFIDVTTPDGRATGLVQDSLVSCVLPAAVDAERINPMIGQLSAALLLQLDACLKAALGLP